MLSSFSQTKVNSNGFKQLEVKTLELAIQNLHRLAACPASFGSVRATPPSASHPSTWPPRGELSWYGADAAIESCVLCAATLACVNF